MYKLTSILSRLRYAWRTARSATGVRDTVIGVSVDRCADDGIKYDGWFWAQTYAPSVESLRNRVFENTAKSMYN